MSNLAHEPSLDDLLPEKKPDDYPAYHNWKRDQTASRMAAMGSKPEEIAAELQLFDRDGNPDPRRAIKAIQRGLATAYKFTSDEMRLQSLQSLTEMKAQLWSQLRSKHILVQQGRVIYDDTGEPVKDDRFALETYDRLLKVEERISKLMGLDSSVRISVEADQIGSEINEMIALIAQVSGPMGLSSPNVVPELSSGPSEDS